MFGSPWSESLRLLRKTICGLMVSSCLKRTWPRKAFQSDPAFLTASISLWYFVCRPQYMQCWIYDFVSVPHILKIVISYRCPTLPSSGDGSSASKPSARRQRDGSGVLALDPVISLWCIHSEIRSLIIYCSSELGLAPCWLWGRTHMRRIWTSSGSKETCVGRNWIWDEIVQLIYMTLIVQSTLAWTLLTPH